MMNERIKKLAEQAGSTHKQSLGVYQFYTDELEKFAELIVQECADRIRHCVVEDSAREYCAKAVELHFGIE